MWDATRRQTYMAVRLFGLGFATLPTLSSRKSLHTQCEYPSAAIGTSICVGILGSFPLCPVQFSPSYTQRRGRKGLLSGPSRNVASTQSYLRASCQRATCPAKSRGRCWPSRSGFCQPSRQQPRAPSALRQLYPPSLTQLRLRGPSSCPRAR